MSEGGREGEEEGGRSEGGGRRREGEGGRGRRREGVSEGGRERVSEGGKVGGERERAREGWGKERECKLESYSSCTLPVGSAGYWAMTPQR